MNLVSMVRALYSVFLAGNFTTLTKIATRRLQILCQCLIILSISSVLAKAQCPAVGYDTTCGVIITVIATGNAPCPAQGCAAITFTGQGPYDNIEDTLVGVVNNSNLPISSLILSSGTSGSQIFAFDGDGICGLDPNTGIPYNPVPPGCPFGPTGYEGPGVSFSNINGSLTAGTVHFNPPIPANGGTAYFSLEEAITSATACSSIINGSVPKPAGGGTSISTTFTPLAGNTLAQAAQLCGFSGWDWQQTITSWPLPSGLLEAGNPVPLHAPPPFNDPPPNGYAYDNPPSPAPLPLYYSPFTGLADPYSLASNETANTLSFFDAPADSCLPGGSGIGCGGSTAPANSKLAFTTHLVGLIAAVGPGFIIQDTGIGFSWTSTFNGTSGGVSVTRSHNPVDPGSGTGGSAIVVYNGVTTYQFPKGIGVTDINGNPVTPTTSTLTLLTASQISVVASGLAYSRATQTFNGTITITNISNATISGPFQIVLNSLTTGVTAANAVSSFGGWPYVTVTATGSLAPGQSTTASVVFKNPANAAITFTPLVYAGSFN